MLKARQTDLCIHTRFARDVYRPVPEIDPEILNAMKMVGTIGMFVHDLANE